MIETVAELLNGLMDEERKKLDQYPLKHGPTIGKMYEGLSSDILGRAIPRECGLQIQSGFIYDDSCTLTGDIDCMLVKGRGEPIPFTDRFKWHVKDVLAVMEIKKTLYSRDLRDAFAQVREVRRSYSRYMQNGRVNGADLSSAYQAFALTTKKVAPSYAELEKLSVSEQYIFHTLVMEQMSPVTIIFGHHGFKSEHALREAMWSFLSDNIASRGFGVGSFPQLIISDTFSLIKMNGQPFSAPMESDFWDFYGSSTGNSLQFILEFIWTKLQQVLPISSASLWGDDLHSYRVSLFLAGRTHGEKGWEFQYLPVPKEILRKAPSQSVWSPPFLDEPQFVIIRLLCEGKIIHLDDAEFIEYIRCEGLSLPEFLDGLLRTHLVALKERELVLITEECACAALPPGPYPSQFVAAENNTGRLTRWLNNQMNASQQALFPEQT